MAWLSGYNKRIKVTADHTKVGSNLSWFPLTIFLKSGDGDTTKIFDELGSNNLKMAITKSDGTTQLYVEIEQWDTTNKVGVLHCGRDGDTLSSSADTDYYIYYDSSHADNTDYVGVKNSTPAQSVWDSNFKAIYHMSDGADTSHIYDSTSNNNDGTKKGANEPIEADGKVAKAQYFDGSNDAITLSEPPASSTNLNTGSLFALIKTSGAGSGYRAIIIKQFAYGMFLNNNVFGVYDWGNNIWRGSTLNLADNNWHYVGFTFQDINGASPSNNAKLYIDGSLVITTTVKLSNHDNGITFGAGDNPPTMQFFKGLIDEVRISSVARSADWIKATYNSLNDSLLTYGAEETNANFFPFF